MPPVHRAIVRALRPSRADAFTHAAAGAREAATSQWNSRPAPTEAQAQAGNYAKGRVHWQGFDLTIEQDTHSMRSGIGADGKPWESRMMAAYGDFAGTRGSDGDPVDVFLGPFPESKTVWVINQTTADGAHDEHKVMAGFVDAQHALLAYRTSYAPGWSSFDPNPVPMSIAQLRQWLASGDMTQPLTPALVPPETAMMTATQPAPLTRVFWDSAAEPRAGLSLADVLYRIRQHDGAEGLVMDPATMDDWREGAFLVLDSAEPGQRAIFDSMVVQAGRLLPKMQALQRIMAAAAAGIEPVSLQISEPLKRFGGLHVAVLFELSDGQTITIWMHNPDSTPNKISPADDLVSWKWMLNKKDFTIAVAPESGQDLNIREVARRAMKLAAKNSAAFARANAKRAETMQIIGDLKAAVAEKQGVLSGLMSDIDAAKQAQSDALTAEQDAWLATKLDADGVRAVVESMGFVGTTYGLFGKGSTGMVQVWKNGMPESVKIDIGEDTDAKGRKVQSYRALVTGGAESRDLREVLAFLDAQIAAAAQAAEDARVAAEAAAAQAAAEQEAAKAAAAVAAPAMESGTVAIYLTQSGKVGAQIKRNVFKSGVSFSWIGEWGAASGGPIQDVVDAIAEFKRTKRGLKLGSGTDITSVEAFMSAPVIGATPAATGPKPSDLWRKISANEYRITALDGSEWTVARVGSKWLTEAGQSFPADALDAAKLAVEDSIAARARTAADEAASRASSGGEMTEAYIATYAEETYEEWEDKLTAYVELRDGATRGDAQGMVEAQDLMQRGILRKLFGDGVSAMGAYTRLFGGAAAAPAAPEVYTFPDASDEARGLFAIGAAKGTNGAYTTAVAIDKAAADMGMRVRWEATDTLPVFDSAVADKVNVFKSGDKVVSLDDNKDYEVTGQRGYQVSVKGRPKALNANRLKLASGKPCDTKMMDSADEEARCDDVLCDDADGDNDAAEDLFDPQDEFDACPTEEDDGKMLDGDFPGHPFRGNQHKKGSRSSGAAVSASIHAKRAEKSGDKKALKSAHRAAHHAHMAAAEGATGKAKTYHKVMAKFHGQQAGRRKVLDDATGGLFGDGDSGYIVGTLSRNGVALATVHLREDGLVAFKVADGITDRTGYTEAEVTILREALETGWREDWFPAMGELATATEDIERSEDAAARQAAEFAAEDKLKAEQDAAIAASEASRAAAIADAEAVGKGKPGFMGVVATGGDAIKAALARKPIGSFVLVAAPMEGNAWGIAMFSRQMLGKGGRSIDSAGKLGNAQVSRLYATADAAYTAGVESLQRAGGVVLSFGVNPAPTREAEAYEAGKAAFAAGLPATPALDPALAPIMQGTGPDAGKVSAAWSRGWMEANAAANPAAPPTASAADDAITIGSVALVPFTRTSRAGTRVWGVRVVENGKEINAADGSGSWFKSDTKANMIADLQRSYEAVTKLGDKTANENRWRENFDLPPLQAAAEEGEPTDAAKAAAVDALYSFNGPESFKAWLWESRDKADYSPFVTAKAMDAEAKRLGATVRWLNPDANSSHVGEILQGGAVVGRIDIAGGDGKAMVFVGATGDQRASYISKVDGERRFYMYSDDDAGEMVTALLAPPAAAAVLPPAPEPTAPGQPEPAAATQRAADMATLGTIAAGTHPDMLEPELADVIENILAAYAGDAEVEAAAERAITAYSNGLMAATA